MQQRVLDIGNCGPDHASISELITNNFAATVDQVDRANDALSLLEKNEYALALVNRILDSDGSSGMDVIRDLKARYPDLPVMIITSAVMVQTTTVSTNGS